MEEWGNGCPNGLLGSSRVERKSKPTGSTQQMRKGSRSLFCPMGTWVQRGEVTLKKKCICLALTLTWLRLSKIMTPRSTHSHAEMSVLAKGSRR